jgi:phosphonate transport system substrate-binding protein
MKKRSIVALLVALVMVLAACASTGSDDTTTTAPDAGGDTTTTAAAPDDTTTTTEADPTADWPEKVIYGFIPSERQDTLADTVQPYMDYLSETLGIEVEGVITADYNGLVVAMGAGQADLGAFGPLGYVQAAEQYPTIELLIQSVRFGSATYHGQWMTNDASICNEPPVVGALNNGPDGLEIVGGDEVVALQVGWVYDDDGVLVQEVIDNEEIAKGTVCIGDLENVPGNSIAFTSASSTSGGLFPQLQLVSLGIDLENDIEYTYVGSHDNAVASVYNGDSDMGLSFDDARRTMRETNPDVGLKVIVFNLTEEIPNDVVAVRGELPDSLKQAIFDATAAYLETEEGVAVFDEIYGWTGIQTANDADFDVVRDAAASGLGSEE